MPKTTCILLFVIFFLSLLSVNSCSQTNKEKSLEENPKNKPVYSIKVIAISDSTFGYEIFQNNSLYIRQLTIPAISGNRYFKTKNQAKKVGNFVLTKLNNGIIPPTISLVELDSLEIAI